MRSQFIDRRTRSKRAVVVEICERGGARRTDVDAVDSDGVEGVRVSGPLHEHRHRRRPGVLDVVEQAHTIAHDEVQVACARNVTCGRSLLIDGRSLSVPSPSRSANAGREFVPRSPIPWTLLQPTLMASKGFALPVLCTNTGAVAVPVFSM